MMLALLDSEVNDRYALRAQRSMPYIDFDEAGFLPGDVVPAAEAWSLLVELHDAYVAQSVKLIQSKGSAEWLWLLRRLRGQFDINSFKSSDGYIQILSEVLAAGVSRESGRSVEAQTFNFDVGPHTLLDLLILRHFAIGLYRLHATMKRCAKGQDVQFFEDAIPYAVPDDVLELAIREYDQRSENGGESSHFSSVGLLGQTTRRPRTSDDDGYGGAVPAWFPLSYTKREGLASDDPPPTEFGWLDLSALGPFQTVPVLDAEQMALIVVLNATFQILAREPEQMARRSQAPIQWGYMVTPTFEFLHPALEESLSWMRTDMSSVLPAEHLPNDLDELLRVLGRMQPSCKPPLPGNPLHVSGDHTVIDLVGASVRLSHTLTRPVDGSGANVFTAEFEAQVQRLIDDTPWKPTGKLRELIGRKISKPNGDRLTDIDTVAVSGNDLILVSCKSVAHTAGLARHEHNAFREYRRKIETAASEWQAVVEAVRSNPEILPVQSARTMEVHGIVVYPSTPFVVEPELRKVGGPLNSQFVVAAGEFETALRNTGA